jgi:hypothetical protein
MMQQGHPATVAQDVPPPQCYGGTIRPWQCSPAALNMAPVPAAASWRRLYLVWASSRTGCVAHGAAQQACVE